jgi:uncharacterized membrane protein YheB (UPF0754 family)
MQWEIITGPVIGAVIGYVTNKIAVEMLFRPINPIYIGKFKVPFTPGIIPKGKERLGKAIGAAVGNNLLTPKVIKETLLSDEMEKEIADHIDLNLGLLSSDQASIRSKLDTIISEEVSQKLEKNLVKGLSHTISQRLSTMNLGELIASEVSAAVQEKVHGTMLAMFVKTTTLAPIEAEIKDRITQYIEEHGEEKIVGYMQEECSSLINKPVSEFIQKLEDYDIKQIVLNLYQLFINQYSEHFLSSLNLSKIVEEKVNAMDTKEVEKLVLSIMEKELGAVVNLGAVIGFILGLVNIFFR